MVDIRQTKAWAEFMENTGWEVEEIQANDHTTNVFIKKIPLLGSVMKIHRPKPPIPFDRIDELAKNKRALFVKIQPYINIEKIHEKQNAEKELERALSSYGYRQDSWPLIPTKTILLDIERCEDELLKTMKKDARYSIRRAQREGVETKIYKYQAAKNTKTFNEFYKMLKKRGKAKKIHVQKRKEYNARIKALDNRAYLILAFRRSNTPISGALIIINESKADYLQAASTKLGRKYFAPYLIIWEAIKLAKSKGCKIFDLEGIHDPRYKTFKKWTGFTIFKKKFGGTEITYPGAYIKYFNRPLKYLSGLID